MTNIWTKIKQNSQYSQKEVENWVSHLQQFKSILIKFNSRYYDAPVEEILY